MMIFWGYSSQLEGLPTLHTVQAKQKQRLNAWGVRKQISELEDQTKDREAFNRRSPTSAFEISPSTGIPTKCTLGRPGVPVSTLFQLYLCPGLWLSICCISRGPLSSDSMKLCLAIWKGKGGKQERYYFPSSTSPSRP